MINRDDVRQKIVKSIGDSIGGVHFINTTLHDRPWLFGGLSKVIEGNSVDEVDIGLDHGAISISGNVSPDSKIVPHSTRDLFIYTPALESNSVSIDDIIASVSLTIEERELISKKRPLDVVGCLFEAVRDASTSDDFIRNFISQLVINGEIKMSARKLPDLVSEIIDLLNINYSGGRERVVNYIKGDRIILEFYEGSGTMMASSFPLTYKGLYGFANMLHMVSKHNDFVM